MNVLFVDSEIVVVEKPGGLLSVPGRGPEKQDCVVNRLRHIYPDMIAQPAVHRLDMHTSGVMVLARTRHAQRNLFRQFEQRLPEKTYHALVEGCISEEKGIIELPFRLDPDNRPYQIYDPVHGKTGVTHWKKIQTEGQSTRIEFHPLTGRTHQLRLHAAHRLGLNAPIIGDALYGQGKEGDQMMLHATSLSIYHPLSNKKLIFTSNVPF